jgi:hypothetical protein
LLTPTPVVVPDNEEKPAKVIDRQRWSSLVRALKTMDTSSVNSDSLPLPLTPTPMTTPETVSVLRCRVGRLDVGVLASEVARVIACPPYIAEEIRQSDAKMLEDDGEYKRIAVLRNVVFPLPHLAQSPSTTDIATLSLIVLKRQGSALVCDAVGAVAYLDRKDITWRSDTTARRWLLGTSLTQRIALIDIDELFTHR